MLSDGLSSRTATLVPAVLLAGYIGLFTWAAISPYDRATWYAENIPIVILVAVLVVSTWAGLAATALVLRALWRDDPAG